MNTPRPLLNAAHAGAPQPADETCELFDLAGHLIKHPADTFYVKVNGHSMDEFGVFDGDILIVDRVLRPEPADIVVVRVNEDYTIKKFKRQAGQLRLVPANPSYSSLEISDETQVCGVATFALHKL